VTLASSLQAGCLGYIFSIPGATVAAWLFLRNNNVVYRTFTRKEMPCLALNFWKTSELYGLAPCIAMVIIFTFLSFGNTAMAIVLVAMNSILQMILIPVYAKWLLGEVSFDVWLVAESAVLYLGLPLMAGFFTRRWGVKKYGEAGFKKLKTYLDSLSIIGLLFTLIVMFALKGDLIVAEPGIILKLAIPMTLFFWSIFVVVYLAGWKLGFNYKDATAVAFNSTGRDFEIAIAIAITAFNPTVALATVVGPLIEVPVMLVLVWFARAT
jgi:ACR3 family arsenite transporter